MYFDLHCHPALKSFLTDTDQLSRDDCWKTYRNCIDFAVGNIIDSQASYRQLDGSQTRIAIAALYAFEDGLDEIYLVRKIAPIISQLDSDMVRDIRPANYYQKMLDEVAHLEGSLAPRGGGKSFAIISSAEQIDLEKNNLVLAIEGAHVLSPRPTDDPIDKLDELKQFRHKIFYLTLCHFTKNPLCTQAFAMKLVNPKKAPVFFPKGTGLSETGKAVIKRAYDEQSGRRMLIDVKHMSISGRQQFYAWKDTQAEIKDLPILASHVGVTGHSWDKDSRRQYFKKIRLVRKFGQVAVEYERPAGLRLDKLKSYFNPASINLYDEDILAVVNSGGLIGLMMDQRQLGAGKKPFEYFAQEDFDRLEAGPQPYREGTSNAGPALSLAEDDDDLLAELTRFGMSEYLSLPDMGIDGAITTVRDKFDDWFGDDGEADQMADPEKGPATYARSSNDEDGTNRHRAPRLNRKKQRHLLHICNNLLHIARVGGAEAWLRMCIGSDFDGLVDAPNNCENVTEFQDLEEHLFDMLSDLIDAGGPGFRERYHLGDLRWQIRRVMFDNGRDFLQRWL